MIFNYMCKIKNLIINNEEEVCEFCGGTGEINTMEQVYPNEPHYAPIGTEKCICQLDEK